MKVSILSPDLSDNCLGRAFLLAKILQKHYEVEIVGPMFGVGIWEPVAYDKSINYKTVKISGKLLPYWQIGQLVSKVDGDVVYVSKPLFSSFGIGLQKKIFKKRPLILDVDDWQIGFRKDEFRKLSFFDRLKFMISGLLYLYNTGSYWNNFLGEKFSRFADEITVSNSFLKEKFGGIVVPHGRDTNAFDPEKFDKEMIRSKYHIKKNRKTVLFFGTPRPHKGVEDLIDAVDLIKDSDVTLVVVGVDYEVPYNAKLIEMAEKRLGKERFLYFGLQPFEKVPEFLALADVVVIPQRKRNSTTGQVPAKVFDAMAMAKPIIATNISDLPDILEGCGWIVESGDPKQLAQKIIYVFDNLQEANKMGFRARQKCIEKYSWDSLEKILLKIFRKYE